MFSQYSGISLAGADWSLTSFACQHQYYVERYLHSSYAPSLLWHKVVWFHLYHSREQKTCYFGSSGLLSRGYFWCTIICYLWCRIIHLGRRYFDNYRKLGVRVYNTTSLQRWMNRVWAHYVVCQYQLKGQCYVTTCSLCFKPCC